MKYLLVKPKVKSKAPNIALMKFTKLFEMKEYEYIYVKRLKIFSIPHFYT